MVSRFLWLLVFFFFLLESQAQLPRIMLKKRGEISHIRSFERHQKILKSQKNYVDQGGIVYLNDYENIQFYGEIGLGTPSQRFKVLFDTGTSISWFPSDRCKDFACRNHKRYCSNESSTFTKNGTKISLHYVTGKLEGFLSTDNLELGEMKIKNQTFAEVTNEPTPALANTLFDGILGLGYPSNSLKHVLTPIQNLVQQGLASGVFSFYLNSNHTDKNGGEIMFGGINEELVDKSTLKYAPVTEKHNWHINVDSVTIEDGPQVCDGGCQAVVGTGTSFLVGPTSAIERINIAIGGYTRPVSGIHTVDCETVSNLPNITFKINGQDFQLRGENYVFKVTCEDGETCVSGFMGKDLPNNTWILGETFIKNFYTVFDMEKFRVGFGKLKNVHTLTTVK